MLGKKSIRYSTQHKLETPRSTLKLPQISIGANLPKQEPLLTKSARPSTLKGPHSFNRSEKVLKQKPIIEQVTTESPRRLQLKRQPSIELEKESPNMKASTSNKRISCCSNVSYSVWDNVDLNTRGITLNEIEEQEGLQQFLKLFKIRSGGFPGQRENLSNEEVIKFAIVYAKQNKKVFKRYFPTKQVIFEDDQDYSQQHDVAKDPNFLKFKQYATSVNRGTPNSKTNL